MRFRTKVACLVQSAAHGINQPFNPGDVVNFDFDIRKEIPSVAPYFEKLDDTRTGIVVEGSDRGAPVEEPASTYAEMTKNDLLAIAAKRGIDLPKRMPNDDIIEVLEASNG